MGAVSCRAKDKYFFIMEIADTNIEWITWPHTCYAALIIINLWLISKDGVFKEQKNLNAPLYQLVLYFSRPTHSDWYF